MRSSILSRSVVAVATLALGSVALAAVPATAATSSGITREQVLAAAAGVRAVPVSISVTPFGVNYGPDTNRTLRFMANRACGIDPDGNEMSVGSFSASTVSGGSAEGLVINAVILDLSTAGSSSVPSGRLCSFGVIATAADKSVLTGVASLTGLPATNMSGDVFVTSAYNSSLGPLFGGGDPFGAFPTFSASGNAVRTVVTKVAVKKTTKQKKAAKSKYAKQLKSYKKAYKKAVDKAGKSKPKKAAAKKAYSKKRATAKAAYNRAIATFKLMPSSTNAPFSVSAKVSAPAAP